eukprot:CAMPEP_0171986624 /NCGR_PEP_ID=MMETSP0993-20121228/274965_1 /TAXON_ID=483369 /ORGANISM="non described non described, Strain CCMP2098" /LENGTH=289 /DNA_ID=CAMNT_0012639535 /DNA_START=27 /DNA_END=896 /DNA_ORIENTATION=+
MQERGVEPNAVSYNAAISACEKGRQWEKAVGLINSMHNRGVEPNVISYSAAISACEKGGQWEKAVELLNSMQDRGVEPNVISYSAAISACGKCGQWEKAVELLNSMHNRGLEPDVVSYSAAISACEKGGQWEKAVELLNTMHYRGVKPNEITMPACIEVLEGAGRFAKADEIMVSAQKLGYFGTVRSSDSEIDLRGCSVAVARTLLRLVLLDLKSVSYPSRDIVIITGQGKGSGERGAVLPDQVRSFLIECSGPQITEVPTNPGRFLLVREDILTWAEAGYQTDRAVTK